VLQPVGGEIGNLERDRCERHAAVRHRGAILRETLVLNAHYALGSGAVRPIPAWIDAQRLHIDALLVHDLEPLRADFVDAAAERHIAVGNAKQILGFRNDAVGVNVDGRDAPSANNHLATAAAGAGRRASAAKLVAGGSKHAPMATRELHIRHGTGPLPGLPRRLPAARWWAQRHGEKTAGWSADHIQRKNSSQACVFSVTTRERSVTYKGILSALFR
jgi:hypothetical protein